MPHYAASKALSRFTVLDLSRVRAGPTAVRQLADWGANVIKIELPEELDEREGMGGPRHGSDFQNLHRNKRSITLNLKEPRGRALLLKMVERADAVVENFRPGVKQRLGIDYPALKAVNRRIILASISGFGQDGPYRDRPGFDQIAQGMGGLMSVTGLPGQGPVRAGIPLADLTAGIFCAYGILVALLEREQSGEGQWLHTSLLQAQIFMLDFQAARWLMEGQVAGQAGNNHPTSIPTGVYPTADGHINIAASGQRMWEKLIGVLKAPELLANPDYNPGAKRSVNRDALNRELGERLRTRTSAEWIEMLNAAGVPCGPIYSIDETFADPQVKHLGIAQAVESQVLGRIELVGQPITMSRTPSALVEPPPERGEHTDQVLAELGLEQSEIDSLRRDKIV
ncbi:MAG TPA: CoA transferase [Candidatus Binataceae bacterium]|nr:CoA transferase [Candidatus Binataceae bacterium]